MPLLFDCSFDFDFDVMFVFDRGVADYDTDNTPRSLRFFSLTFPTHKSTRPPHFTTTLSILLPASGLRHETEKGLVGGARGSASVHRAAHVWGMEVARTTHHGPSCALVRSPRHTRDAEGGIGGPSATLALCANGNLALRRYTTLTSNQPPLW